MGKLPCNIKKFKRRTVFEKLGPVRNQKLISILIIFGEVWIEALIAIALIFPKSRYLKEGIAAHRTL